MQLSLPKGGGGKKKGNKLLINAFLVAIGNGIKLDYIIEEEHSSYTYTVHMSSGDAFIVNSEVQGLQFAVSEVKPLSMPKGLILREGALLLTVERE